MDFAYPGSSRPKGDCVPVDTQRDVLLMRHNLVEGREASEPVKQRLQALYAVLPVGGSGATAPLARPETADIRRVTRPSTLGCDGHTSAETGPAALRTGDPL